MCSNNFSYLDSSCFVDEARLATSDLLCNIIYLVSFEDGEITDLGEICREKGTQALTKITDIFMKGVGGLVPLASLMILAFAIGDTCDALGTGPFVAQAAKATLNPGVIPAVLFLISCFIAFSTGTSWGTFAIMIPIAVPIIRIIGLHPGLIIAAVLGGG